MVYTDAHPLNTEPLLKGMIYFKLIRSIFLSLNLECQTMGFAVLIVEDLDQNSLPLRFLWPVSPKQRHMPGDQVTSARRITESPRSQIHLANAPGGTSYDSHLALRLHETTLLQLQITYKYNISTGINKKNKSSHHLLQLLALNGSTFHPEKNLAFKN